MVNIYEEEWAQGEDVFQERDPLAKHERERALEEGRSVCLVFFFSFSFSHYYSEYTPTRPYISVVELQAGRDERYLLLMIEQHFFFQTAACLLAFKRRLA